MNSAQLRSKTLQGPWPNFFLTGPSKSASTSLYAYLRQHPQIYLPAVKEPSYFAAYSFDERIRWIGPPQRRPRPTCAQYLELYQGVTDEVAIGDASTSSFAVHACRRIAEQLPQARLIAVLRHPVDRAYSRFLHLRRAGIEPLADFGAAYAASAQRMVAGWYPGLCYHTPGLYVQVVRHFFACFPRTQISLQLYDDLQQDAPGLLRDLYAFLGVATEFQPDLATCYNRAQTPRTVGVEKLRQLSLVRKSLHRLPPAAGRWLRRAAMRTPPPLEPALRTTLTLAYSDEFDALEELLARDLSVWRV